MNEVLKLPSGQIPKNQGLPEGHTLACRARGARWGTLQTFLMHTLKVAAVQLSAHDRTNFTAVWPMICNRVREAAQSGAELIVLPEGTIPGYVLEEDPLEPAIVESAVTQLCDIVRNIHAVLVCGVARMEDNRVYNSAIVIEKDGTIAGHADKIFLWHFDRRWFTSGERIRPIATSVGKLGVLICADGRMPMIASELVDAGAEMLVMPTAWVTSERDSDNSSKTFKPIYSPESGPVKTPSHSSLPTNAAPNVAA